MLTDNYGRQITYMRISITDRCNLRCVYCMPPEGMSLISHEKVMRYEEITALVREAASCGIKEIRITGGEPLVKRDIPDLIKMLAAIPGIEDISLTTNAILLESLAGPLAQAGLNRINISLDTLNAEKFSRITRGGSLEQVWRGVQAAEANHLDPIKFNMVVIRGVNDDEVVNMARLSMEHPWVMRFIELMPINNQASMETAFPSNGNYYFSIKEMKELLAPLGLSPLETKTGRGPAKEYRLLGACGKIGFISPLGEHFCQRCNRLRLTADGSLRPCLLSDIEIPILDALRKGESMLPYLEKAVKLKPEGHLLANQSAPASRCMRQIGG